MTTSPQPWSLLPFSEGTRGTILDKLGNQIIHCVDIRDAEFILNLLKQQKYGTTAEDLGYQSKTRFDGEARELL